MKPMEVRLVGRFRFTSKLEGEHQSLLYKAIHSQTNEHLVLKGEEIKDSKINKKGFLSLLQEGKIYQSMQGGIGIPYMHWCGQQEDYNFIVLEEMQCNLQKLLTICNKKFSLKTSILIGIELVTILQYFHFKYFTYNNLNLRHVMLGSGDKYNKLYLIDFSRANRYRDPNNLQHNEETNEKINEIRNYNMQFSSLNYHKGRSISRKDDMISLLYLILYLLEGELPWSHEVRNMKKTQYQKSRYIIDLKDEKEKNLFSKYPQLQSLFNYTMDLKFSQKPQYAYFISTFSQILQKKGLIQDKIFDWMLIDQPQPEQLNHQFDIYSNQQQFIQKVQFELHQPGNEKLSIKNITSNDKGKSNKTKRQKQCEIY